ncbi:unnamed protein product, partial [Rotaria sp. Silwood2]
DTSGMERFRAIRTAYYRGMNGALLIFNLTDPTSFNNIGQWIDEAHKFAPADMFIVLVGNKSDLVAQRKITFEQATALAKQLNLSYMETSAFNSSNIKQVFATLATCILHQKTTKSIGTA